MIQVVRCFVELSVDLEYMRTSLCKPRDTSRVLTVRLVEDSCGHAIGVTILFALSRPAIAYTPKRIQRLYPIGACFVIREPYVRFGVKGLPEITVPWAKDMVEVPLSRAMTLPYGLEVSILA